MTENGKSVKVNGPEIKGEKTAHVSKLETPTVDFHKRDRPLLS